MYRPELQLTNLTSPSIGLLWHATK